MAFTLLGFGAEIMKVECFNSRVIHSNYKENDQQMYALQFTVNHLTSKCTAHYLLLTEKKDTSLKENVTAMNMTANHDIPSSFRELSDLKNHTFVCNGCEYKSFTDMVDRATPIEVKTKNILAVA